MLYSALYRVPLCLNGCGHLLSTETHRESVHSCIILIQVNKLQAISLFCQMLPLLLTKNGTRIKAARKSLFSRALASLLTYLREKKNIRFSCRIFNNYYTRARRLVSKKSPLIQQARVDYCFIRFSSSVTVAGFFDLVFAKSFASL